jgi:hypothetical protein
VAAAAEGSRRTSLPPGASLDLDAVEVAVESAGSAPACAALVGAWTWDARTVAGPADGVVVTATRMGSEVTIGQGAAGAAPSGCALLSFNNEGDTTVEIEVRFAIGALGSG